MRKDNIHPLSGYQGREWSVEYIRVNPWLLRTILSVLVDPPTIGWRSQAWQLTPLTKGTLPCFVGTARPDKGPTRTNADKFLISIHQSHCRYGYIRLYLSKLQYFTNLNLAAIKGDDFPMNKPWFPGFGKTVRSWWNLPSGNQTWQWKKPCKWRFQWENHPFLWWIFQLAMFHWTTRRAATPNVIRRGPA